MGEILTSRSSPTYIETDFGKTIRLLDGISSEKEQKRILKGLLSSVGSHAKNVVRKNYGNYLNRRSSTLYNSIDKKLLKSGKGVIVTAYARKDNKQLYGYALHKGATILPKRTNKSHLLWLPDICARVRSVTLPKRPFVVDPVMAYVKSEKHERNVTKYLDKQVARVTKEANG